MRQEERLYLGIDLGGTKILAAVANARGEIVARDQTGTHAEEGQQAVIRAIVESGNRALERAGINAARLSGVGIGAAGASNPETGILASSPHLPGWRDVPLRDIIQQHFGVRTVLGNDANAAALGEFYFGAGREARCLVYVTLSTGIGGGIIIDGQLYSGASGAAGEIGHMTIDVHGPRCFCGNIGCWEMLASGTALAREARQRINRGDKTNILECATGNIELVTAETVHRAALGGDTVALELIAGTSYYVGVGFVNLLNIFNPELVIIGGGLANMGDLLLKPAIQLAGERAFKPAFEAARFTRAALGENSGVLGAVTLVMQHPG